jgi:hypothetical protein
MAYALRPGVSYCESGGRLVFLDLAGDRYFCLADSEEAGFRALADGDGRTDGGTCARLAELGLIEPAEKARLGACAAPPRPSDTILDRTNPEPPGCGLLVRAAAALARARIRLSRQGLFKTVRALEERRRPAARDSAWSAYRTAEIAVAFERLGLLVAPRDQCLPRSLALAGMLFRRGCDAQFVIGVQLRPFLAHSWVQSGHLLLNERVDIARSFTPVLVI